MGFYTSPFQNALVVSYDGGGDDGHYNVFYGAEGTVQRVSRLQANLGCSRAAKDIEDEWAQMVVHREVSDSFGDAGKIMGYSAVAADRPTVPAIERVVEMHLASFFNGTLPRGVLPTEMLKLACESKQNQELLAAELQKQWQQRSLKLIRTLLDALGTQPVDGLVLVGGAALNVVANQYIQDTLGMEVFVPSAPNDCGLSLGGLFSVAPPVQRQPMQYLGLRLWDLEDLHREAQLRQASKLSQLGGVAHLAKLLATSTPAGRKPIVALVRGRQEFGPRALGHRSLVAVPDTEEMKERMNRLKFRTPGDRA
eukprot:Skav204877  [mRNA]  locus=scaffold2602:44188:45960:+ [translate_table: standard]